MRSRRVSSSLFFARFGHCIEVLHGSCRSGTALGRGDAMLGWPRGAQVAVSCRSAVYRVWVAAWSTGLGGAGAAIVRRVSFVWIHDRVYAR